MAPEMAPMGHTEPKRATKKAPDAFLQHDISWYHLCSMRAALIYQHRSAQRRASSELGWTLAAPRLRANVW